MFIKNTILLIFFIQTINAMDQNKQQIAIARRDYLIAKLKYEQEISQNLMLSSQTREGYYHYLETTENCNHKRELLPEQPHPKDVSCSTCKRAYDNADEATKILINQKGHENEICMTIADLIDIIPEKH